MIKNIVYALESPFDGKVYYVGKSEKGLNRPYSHLVNSHNKELKNWLFTLKRDPIVKILEKNAEDLISKERYWINEFVKRGEPLFNKLIPNEKQLKYADYEVGQFIKMQRKNVKLTQKEFADKSGLGLRFIRELEQGKETCRLDKVLQALKMFGATLIPIIK
jgi:y4mF family transcriptional regulator